MTPVDLLVRDLIARRGALPLEEVVELALYHPEHGFYAGRGHAGRRGDFMTSPEVGPLFGAVVARALDAWWVEAGSPQPFVVVEAGAGPGTLARAVLAAEPACAPALRYVLVERSVAQRQTQAERLPLEAPEAAFAAVPEADDDRPAPARVPAGPIVVSLGELPRVPGPCIVLANELLDNLPFGLSERTARGWSEVRVAALGDHLVEALVPLPPDDAAVLDRLVPDAPTGARLPRPRAISAWLRDALALAGDGGRIVAFDYCATSAELAARPPAEGARTYRRHGRGRPPLEALGTQDLTCDVAVDQLEPAPMTVRTQAEWLRSHGIEGLVEDGRRTWRERAHIGDLAALRARSRTTEADALLDISGLGAFCVLLWINPASSTRL